jgi:hypothetical protein
MEQLFWKKMHIAVRVSDDTGAMSPDARRFSDKLLVFMNGCLSCIKSKLLQAFHKPFHVLDFQHPMCPLRVARIGGALLKKKCGVQRALFLTGLESCDKMSRQSWKKQTIRCIKK